MLAVRYSELETLEFLLSNGADVNVKVQEGEKYFWTALAAAVVRKRYFAAAILLEAGADPIACLANSKDQENISRNWDLQERDNKMNITGADEERDIFDVLQFEIHRRTAAALSVMSKELPQHVLHEILTLMWTR